MATYGVTSPKFESQFKSLGLTLLEPNNLKDIPKVAKVFIYDYNGVLEKPFLKALVTAGCTVVYSFFSDGEDNTKYLADIGNYNCYDGVEPTEITADFITKSLEQKRSKDDVETIINKSTTISSLNVCVSEVDSFLQAINNKDKDDISRIFNSSFSIMLEIKKLVDEKVRESEINRRKGVLNSDKVDALNTEIESLKDKIKNLVTAGKVVEKDNKKLSDEVAKLDAELTERESALENAHEQIAQLTAKVNEGITEKTSMERKLAEAVGNTNILTAKNEDLMRQLDVFSSSMTKKFSVENIKLNLTNTGTVSKILYVKVVDPVPYLVSSFSSYPRYIANAKHKDRGCAFLLIVPSDSTLYNQYKESNPVLRDGITLENCKDKMYVMQGFDTVIEKFIQNCGCDLCLILDMTFKADILTKSFRQKEVYVINNPDTISRNLLNPKECISFNTMVDKGVAAHIPILTQEELTTYKGLVSLKTSLFTILDSFWG